MSAKAPEAGAVATASPPIAPIPTQSAPPPHDAASVVEQEHIKQALEASQTAIDAISSLLSMSQWVLGILALVVGVIAIFGWGAIRSGVLAQSKQIANKRMSDYIKSQEFADLLFTKIDEAVERREQDRAAERLTEDRRDASDAPAFEELK